MLKVAAIGNMVLSDFYRRKIRVLSFLLIVMVVYLHGYYVEGQKFVLFDYFQTFIGGGIFRIANPLFFCISGFLFFLNISSYQAIFLKMKKRLRTLVVPYIAWNLIFVGWYGLLSLIPWANSFVSENVALHIFSQERWSGILFDLFVKPASFPLWFLRNLIVMVAFSPLIYFLLQKMRWLLPVLAVICSFGFSHAHGLAFFAMGGCIALFSSLERVTQVALDNIRWAFPVFVIAALCYPFHFAAVRYVLPLADVCGLMVVWYLYDRTIAGKSHSLEWALGYSFFIYVFHEPFFNIIKKAGLHIMGVSEWTLFVLYVLNPIIAILTILFVAKTFQRSMPALYALLTGGRK